MPSSSYSALVSLVGSAASLLVVPSAPLTLPPSLWTGGDTNLSQGRALGDDIRESGCQKYMRCRTGEHLGEGSSLERFASHGRSHLTAQSRFHMQLCMEEAVLALLAGCVIKSHQNPESSNLSEICLLMAEPMGWRKGSSSWHDLDQVTGTCVKLSPTGRN